MMTTMTTWLVYKLTERRRQRHSISWGRGRRPPQPIFLRAGRRGIDAGLAKAVPPMDLLTVKGYKGFRKQLDVFRLSARGAAQKRPSTDRS